MWSRFDLKVRLTLQVAAVLALCFAAISAYFLVEADKALRARLDSLAERLSAVSAPSEIRTPEDERPPHY